VLIEDVLRRARTGFTALTWLGQQHLAVLVAPAHIDAKVREHLPAVAARTGCSVELARHTWNTVYRPLIRFIDLPDAFPPDHRVAAVAHRDEEDGPLAHLAVLLGPCVVLTSDGHLTSEGIGDADWLTAVLLLKRFSELDAMVSGGGQFAWVSLRLLGLGMSSIGRRLMQSELALGATIGVVLGSAFFLRPQLRTVGASTWAQVEPALEQVMEFTVDGILRRAEAEAALRTRLMTVDAPPTAEQATARLLALHGDPMASADIHIELERGGHEISLAVARTMLRQHPSFVSVPGRGFQLGRCLGPPAL
jgi:hypothetical protein